MILDLQNQLSDSQALTATALSTNVIDLGVSNPIGVGEPMAVVFNVEVAADQGTGDEDYTFAIEVGSNAGISSARQELGRMIFESGTPTAPALDADLLVAGFVFAIPLPIVKAGVQNRYLGARYTLAGTSPSVTVSAHLVPMKNVPAEVIYQKGYSIQ